ncbi:hypothetical protein PVAP13_5KG166507 [Panicum virgatum]|uniref:Uncharacterized protein n=1 Tax=Panicum virgatum TaxID=38727 RepID=A0A8T0SDT9_PANVG|nr:hypothetical protein PVAP13_5KG166507 [Panicum virgatum]
MQRTTSARHATMRWNTACTCRSRGASPSSSARHAAASSSAHSSPTIPCSSSSSSSSAISSSRLLRSCAARSTACISARSPAVGAGPEEDSFFSLRLHSCGGGARCAAMALCGGAPRTSSWRHSRRAPPWRSCDGGARSVAAAAAWHRRGRGWGGGGGGVAGVGAGAEGNQEMK